MFASKFHIFCRFNFDGRSTNGLDKTNMNTDPPRSQSASGIFISYTHDSLRTTVCVRVREYFGNYANFKFGFYSTKRWSEK